jgi:membrane-associated protein
MDVASTLSSVPAPVVYAIVAGLGLSEGALGGIVIPGAVTLVAAGALAATGAISLPLVILLAVVATLAGDTLGFALGRRLGDRLAATRVGRLIGVKNWDRARSVIERGTLALAASRWVGFVRSMVPALVGASGVAYTHFLRANALGVVTYVPTMLLVGYVSVEGAEQFGELLVTYGPAVFTVALAAALGVLVARSRLLAVLSGSVA